MDLRDRMLRALLAFAAMSCATPYQPEAFTGGYSEMQVAKGAWIVGFRGNGYTRPKRAQDLALLRGLELVQDAGCDYYRLLDASSAMEYGGTLVTTNAYGATAVPIRKPAARIAIGCATADTGLEAAVMARQIRTEYRIERRSVHPAGEHKRKSYHGKGNPDFPAVGESRATPNGEPGAEPQTRRGAPSISGRSEHASSGTTPGPSPGSPCERPGCILEAVRSRYGSPAAWMGDTARQPRSGQVTRCAAAVSSYAACGRGGAMEAEQWSRDCEVLEELAAFCGGLLREDPGR